MSYFRAAMAGGVTRLSTLIFGFASTIIVARVLGAEQNGIVAYAIWLSTTAVGIAELGIGNVLTRYGDGYRFGVDWKDQSGTLFLPFAVATTAMTLAFVGWGLIQYGHGDVADAVFWFATAVLAAVTGLAVFAGSIARGLRRWGEASRDVLIGCLLQVPAVFVGAWYFGVPGAICGYLVRNLPQAISLRHYVDPRRLRSIVLSKPLKSYARDSWLSNLSGMLIWTRVEYIFIGFYCDNLQIGYYTIGLSLASLMNQLSMQLSGEIVPFLGRHHDDDDHDEIKKIYQSMSRMMALLMFPLCLGGAAITPELVSTLFGAAFVPATRVSELLVAMSAVSALATVPASLIASRERTDVFVWATPLAGFLMVTGLAVTVPFGEGLAAAAVRSVVHGLWFVGLTFFVWRTFRIALPIASLTRILISAAACAVAARLTIVSVPGPLGIVAAIGVGAIVYLLSLRLTRAFADLDRDDFAAMAVPEDRNALQRLLLVAVDFLAPHAGRAER